MLDTVGAERERSIMAQTVEKELLDKAEQLEPQDIKGARPCIKSVRKKVTASNRIPRFTRLRGIRNNIIPWWIV